MAAGLGFLVILGLLGVGAVFALAFLIRHIAAAGQNHPSNLSSESRRLVRPVTEGVEALEKLVGANPGSPEVKVIGPQALEAARKVRQECVRWAQAREALAGIARKEGEGGRASELMAKIERKIGEAAEEVDRMVARMAERSVAEYAIPEEDSLDELVKRLESLGQSMDEAQETFDVRVR